MLCPVEYPVWVINFRADCSGDAAAAPQIVLQNSGGFALEISRGFCLGVIALYR